MPYSLGWQSTQNKLSQLRVLHTDKTKNSPGVGLLVHLFVSVMGAALDDFDHLSVDAVDDAVRVIDPAAPVAGQDRKSTRLNSSHIQKSRMPSSA